jgi:hypothetical protein
MVPERCGVLLVHDEVLEIGVLLRRAFLYQDDALHRQVRVGAAGFRLSRGKGVGGGPQTDHRCFVHGTRDPRPDLRVNGAGQSTTRQRYAQKAHDGKAGGQTIGVRHSRHTPVSQSSRRCCPHIGRFHAVWSEP